MTPADLATWLNTPALLAWGAPLSWAEVLGFATGIWCVWLTAERRLLNFPVGIANCLLLLFLFWQSRLFADASLQLLFIALGLQGWLQWTRGRVGEAIPVSDLSPRALLAALGAGLTLTALLYIVLTWAKGSVPLFDALITALSIVAQWLLNARKRQTWYFWIVVDLISIPVYVHKQLYLIALLYAVFLGLCLLGLRAWSREQDGNGRATGEVAA